MTAIHSGNPASKPTSPPQPAPSWRGRDLVGLQGLSRAELVSLLAASRDTAHRIEQNVLDPVLRGRVVATMFFEDSTRTRSSFTVAAQRAGASVVDLSAGSSSVNKGETLIDTARNIEAMGVDAIIVRARQSGAAQIVAQSVACPVINAGDGRHEHPTQGLLDTLTIASRFERDTTFDLSGLNVVIVGDIASSRVARSGIAALTTLGASVTCVGPSSMAPSSLSALGCTVAHELDPLLPAAHAVMMLRIQFERADAEASAAAGNKPEQAKKSVIASVREYRRFYALSAERAERMRPGAIVLHPGPINRGIELDADVADGPRSVIMQQVKSGVAVRAAVLSLLVGGPRP